MQQSIAKFIALSYRHCTTCFGHYHTHHQEPVKLLANRPRLRTLPPPHSYGNQRLQRQFDGLLMMGMVMPETCCAVSVRQSNKFYDWLLHLVECFYLSDWRCTEPQTLKNNNRSNSHSQEKDYFSPVYFKLIISVNCNKRVTVDPSLQKHCQSQSQTQEYTKLSTLSAK